ncbi:MAG: methyltransferase domain-containing protein [Halobacteriota archaeon]
MELSAFKSVYHGKPPWDIGRLQEEYVQLEQTGEISRSVLDVGCGTGENALYLAERGHGVWGIDFTLHQFRGNRSGCVYACLY